jgi:hypothetical protein
MAEQTKRQQLELHLAARALQDPAFREKLLVAPKETIEEEIGLHFPLTLEIKIHEEKLNVLHVVLPIDIETSSASETESITNALPPLPFWKRICRRNQP